jgi:hypothetical protein
MLFTYTSFLLFTLIIVEFRKFRPVFNLGSPAFPLLLGSHSCAWLTATSTVFHHSNYSRQPNNLLAVAGNSGSAGPNIPWKPQSKPLVLILFALILLQIVWTLVTL